MKARIIISAALLALTALATSPGTAQHRMETLSSAARAAQRETPVERVTVRLPFEESGFAQFIASPAGRWLRIGAGLGMIAGGIAMDDTGGAVLAGAGLIPLSAGALDLCYLSPLFGGPIRGEEIRAAGR